MLLASRQAQKQVYAPHAAILQQGQAVGHFSMITGGEVEIVVGAASPDNECREICLARLGAGQFFGEVELTLGHDSIASVRASEHGAELAVLSRQEFFQLIDGSPLTRGALRQEAEKRMAENRRRKTDC